MAILSKLNTIPIKIPPAFCVEVDKLILKFIQNFKRPRIVKTILEKNKDGRHTFSSQNLLQSNNSQDYVILALKTDT